MKNNNAFTKVISPIIELSLEYQNINPTAASIHAAKIDTVGKFALKTFCLLLIKLYISAEKKTILIT